MYSANSQARFGYFWVAWVVLTLVAIVAGGMGMHPAAPAWVTTAAATVWSVFIVPLVPIALVQQARTSYLARGFVIAGWLMAMCFAAFFVASSGVIGHFDGERLSAGALKHFVIGGGLAGIAVVVGLLLYTPPGRQLAAQVTPIHPQSFTDATALATVVPSIAFCLIPLIVLHRPPILDPELLKGLEDRQPSQLYVELLGQLACLVFLSVFAAGFPLVRSLGAALRRLGVGRFSAVGFCVAIGLALALVATVPYIHEAIRYVWQTFGWPATDDKLLKDLFESMLTPKGAIVVGLTAGISEELLFRGLLQPKIGIWLANTLFAAVHAFQYNWDGVLLVFFIGLVCGLVRRRYNTAAAMITHGLYDTLLVLLAVWTGQ